MFTAQDDSDTRGATGHRFVLRPYGQGCRKRCRTNSRTLKGALRGGECYGGSPQHIEAPNQSAVSDRQFGRIRPTW